MPRHRIRSRLIAGGIVCGWLCLPGALAAGPQAPTAPLKWTYQNWLARRDAGLKDPGLIRYYSFGAWAAGAESAPDLTGKGAPVRPGFEGQAAKNEPRSPVAVDGLWPGTKAARLDRAFFHADAFPVGREGFTIEAWLRTNGPGVIRGDAVPMGGTLLSQGTGYWDGWRVTLLYPQRSIGFEIGRPKPSTSIGIQTAPVADGVWHHVAATWDGRHSRLYVDGQLAAEGAYAGAYTPPPAGPGAPGFRLGFAAAGWGSAVLDVAEVAVHSRAIAPLEVLRRACLLAPLPDATAKQVEAARRAEAEGNRAAAADKWRGVLASAALAAPYAAMAHLKLAELDMARRDVQAAAGHFLQAADMTGTPEGIRYEASQGLLRLALGDVSGQKMPREAYDVILKMPGLSPGTSMDVRLGFARRYGSREEYAAAIEEYRKTMEKEATTPRKKLDVHLRLGRLLWEVGDAAGARGECEKIVAAPDAPGHYRSYAQLQVAQSYARQKDLASAKAAYEKVAGLADAPAHHKQEAIECIGELDRVRAGLPARDPASSRVAVPKAPQPAVELYVAPDGSGQGDGTRAKPLAGLASARDAIRAIKARGPLPKGGVTVWLADGEYPLTETFKLAAQDSGTPGSPIVYRAGTGGGAVLTGGVRLSGFKAVVDPAILQRLPKESRGKVLQLDLKAAGITDFGELRPRGVGRTPSPAVELFCDGMPMTLARWPNTGFVHSGKVIKPQGTGESSAGRGAAFEYEGDRPARWVKAPDAWLFGYWRYLWADGTLPVASIDTKARRITTAQPYAYGDGMVGHMPYYAFNLLEELDSPGEWYLDRGTGTLYFWPPGELTKATVHLSMLSVPMVKLDEVRHVTLRGLTFELGRTDGVIIEGGADCLLAGCVVRRLGGTGVTIRGGRDHGVLGCDIHTLGRGGVSAAGGDRKTLSAGGHFVVNCDIHDLSRIDRTYTPAIFMDGVGSRIAHNLMHHSASSAIRLEGNDHLVELNDVHHVLLESDDQGGLDMWGNPTYRGNVLRWNYWHDIGGGELPCGQAGIRLDDAISGVLVYGNVFSRCSRAQFGGIQIHGGKENVVENNVFFDCRYAISFSPWGPGGWKAFLANPRIVQATTKDVDIRKPPYSTRYPALAHLGERPDVNMIWRNLAVGCGAFLTRDRNAQDLMDNVVTQQDPGFVDAAKGDFRLRPDAGGKLGPGAPGFGFRPIPFEEIGLYEDELRPKLPARD